MLVKHIVQIMKKYKEFQKTLKSLKEMANNSSCGYTAEQVAKLYGKEYAEYVKFMNSPLSALDFE